MSATPVAIPSVDAESRHPFPRDVFDFLLEFSVALSRLAAYPAGHPSTRSAAHLVAAKLNRVLADRPRLSIGVTRDGFVVDDLASDPRQRLLRNLAEKLHSEQLGGMTFTEGASESEVAEMLATLVRGSSMADTPLGLGIAEEISWRNVRLHPISYDRLALWRDTPAGAPLDSAHLASHALWIQLADIAAAEGNDRESGEPEFAALAFSDPSESALETARTRELPVPGEIARRLNSGGTGFEKRVSAVSGILFNLASSAGISSGDASPVQVYLSELISALSDETLERILEMEGDPELRRKFVVAASEGLAADAMLSLARAAAVASKATISSPLLRVMSKMASVSGQNREAESSVRSLVQQTVASWGGDGAAPQEYLALLNLLAGQTPDVSGLRSSLQVDPISLLGLGLELELSNSAIIKAAETLVLAGKGGMVLDSLERDNRPGNAASAAIRAHVLQPDLLYRTARAGNSNFEVIERMATSMGGSATEPLLDILATTDDRALRARLLTLLPQIVAPGLGAMVMQRLQGSPWFVQRNLLDLLYRLPELPREVQLSEYLRHSDARVRRAALKLGLKLQQHREQALLLALADKDEGIIAMALGAALQWCPPSASRQLQQLFDSPSLTAEQRLSCLKLLGAMTDKSIRAKLVELVLVPRGFLRRARLRPKSPEMLVALGGLATSWRNDREVDEILQMAETSNDSQIRDAAAPMQMTGARP